MYATKKPHGVVSTERRRELGRSIDDSRLTSSSHAWAIAHELARKGFYVFPVSHHSKAPLTSDGFKSATRDHAQIARWARSAPWARVGVAPGLSGVAVVDVDPRNDLDGSVNDLALVIFDGIDTPHVRTPSGGEHIYCRATGIRSSHNKLSPGVDIKSTGGYVIAAGAGYELISGDFGRVAPMPTTLYQTLLELQTPVPRSPRPFSSSSDFLSGFERYLDKLKPICEGCRNDTLFKLGSWLAGRGASRHEIEDVLDQVNVTEVRPPLPASEVASIARSAGRYALGIAS